MIKNSLKKSRFSKSTNHYVQNSGTSEKSASGRFSKQLLHDIRNLIPIQRLIEIELVIPNHTHSGIFRFECPLCNGYHSSVKQDTNLARCFDCQTNFNTIEIVMNFRKMDFRPAVLYLISILKTISQKRSIRPTGSSRKPDEPVSIRDSLQSLTVLGLSGASPKLVEQRIQNLEKEIETMNERMNQFHKFLVREFKKEV